MAIVLSKAPFVTAYINDRSITVEPGETLLQAALRNGIDFPNSCRVGACGSCKCRVLEGKAKELTETGYLLSAAEIDGGYILACQSVPLSNLSIEVDLSQQSRRRRVTGRVIAQEKVTHDITRLTLQLDGAMPYTAGQFAYVSIDGLDGVVRSYSFATPARKDSRVSFFVRKVPGGQFSSLVNDADVLGRSVHVEGPEGNFWLRPGAEPILFVAGGSGLAPILAILEEAVASRVSRSATLLFGAREEQDLYALDAIQSIAQRWHGTFQFVPVLSAVGEDSTWTGKRGFVTEAIPELLENDAHVYLCGPPVMIDGALGLLEELSVPSKHIYFDRFTTQADGLAADASQPTLLTAPSSSASFAGILHYLKYFLLHGVGLLAIGAILAGGHHVTVALLVVLTIYIVGDVFFGDDTSTPKFKYPRVLTAQLWLALPLLALIVFTGVWSVCSNDPLGFGAWLTQWIGYDIVAARDATAFVHHGSTWLITGLMLGMVGTITAHELTHRTWDPISMLIGRWLLAFIFDTTFSIEHV
jgi:NAD(P)H-flavin reductase/ferredoxin